MNDVDVGRTARSRLQADRLACWLKKACVLFPWRKGLPGLAEGLLSGASAQETDTYTESEQSLKTHGKLALLLACQIGWPLSWLALSERHHRRRQRDAHNELLLSEP